MRLIKQIISEKMKRHDLYSSQKHYIKSIWQFSQALNLSLVVLELELPKKEVKKINKTYQKIIISRTLDENQIKYVNIFINKYVRIVIDALDKIEEMSKESQIYGEEIERKDFIMMNAYEFDGLGN